MADIQGYYNALKENGYDDNEIQQIFQKKGINVQQPAQTQQAPKQNLLKTLFHGLVDPAIDYGKYVGEAGIQAGKFALNKPFRKAVLGQDLTPEEQNQLAQQKKSYLVDEDKIADRGDIIKTGLKATAGGASYAIPVGGGALTVGGKTLLPAVAQTTAKMMIPRLMAQGAVSGGLYGYSQSKEGQEGKDTLTGAVSGGVAAPLFGYLMPKAVQATVGGVKSKLGREAVDEVTRMGTKKGTTATKLYLSNFENPTKLSKQLKPQETAEAMLKYNITGNVDDISSKASSITGNDGFLTKFQRGVISQTKDEVDVGDAMKAVTSQLDDIAELTPNEQKRIMSGINKLLPKGTKPSSANAMDVFDSVKALEDLGYQYYNSSTYLTKNLKNEQIGKVYLTVAENLKDSLEKGVRVQGGIKGYITPELLTQARQISPQLADDLSKVNTLAELRALQAPFVRVQKMAELTNMASLNTMKNLDQSTKGVSKMVPSLQDPLAPLRPILASGKINTKVASAINKAGSPRQAIAGKIDDALASDLGAYEKIMNTSGNVQSLEKLAQKHLGDARFLIHRKVGMVPNAKEEIMSNIVPYLGRILAPAMANDEQAPSTPVTPTEQATPAPSMDLAQLQKGYTPQAQKSGVGLSKEDLMIFSLLDPGNADTYKMLYDLSGDTGSKEDLNVSKVSAQNYNNAQSGMGSLQQATSLIFNPDGTLNSSTILGLKTPGRPKSESRQLAAYLYNVADAYLRLRTGATANPTEIKKLAKNLEPGLTDDAETVKTKFSIYNDVFNGVLGLSNQTGASTETIDSTLLNELLQSGYTQ